MSDVVTEAAAMDCDIDEGSARNLEQLKDELEDVERLLAVRLKLRGSDVRRRLLAMARLEQLEEDELVVRWLELYTVYADLLRWEVDTEPPAPSPSADDVGSRAAEAALALLCAETSGLHCPT